MKSLELAEERRKAEDDFKREAEVLAAWQAASQSFVNLVELQDRVGEKIAALLDVEAALVTTGAAGGIAVGTAAAVTLRDHSLVGRLPLPPEG